MKEYKIIKIWLQILAVTVLLLVSPLAGSAEIPDIDKKVSLIAREQPIELFLQELFGQLTIPVTIDEAVTGTVNGTFESISARKIFSDIAKSFSLIMYYDGAVAHIYTSNNLTRRILPAPELISKHIVKAAYELDLVDRRNTIRKAVDGGLVVTGTKRFIEQIDELLYAAKNNMKDYELPVGFKVFYLKYAWAQDVTLTFSGRQVIVPGVATILRQLLEDAPQSYVQNQYRDNLLKPVLPSLRGKGLNSIGADDRVGLPDNPNVHNVYAQSPQNANTYNVSNTNYQNTNRVRIQADPRLNAIIIRDSPVRMARYQHLIDKLDVEPQMLEIEATIIDINTTRMRELGINWRWQNNDDQVLFGNGTDSDISLNPVDLITPKGRGGFISFVLGDNAKFIGRINALEEEGALHVVSSPHVLTLSNVEAIFEDSSTFYVRVAGRDEVDLFNVSVGISLRVTPHVFKDNGKARIKLLVTIEDGRKEDDFVDKIPLVSRSAINTQALLDAGESVLIGGIVREETDDDEYKVPFIGDVPIIGNLFKNTTKKKVHIERMFLISPKLSVRKVASNSDISKITQSDLSNKIGANDMSDEVQNDDETIATENEIYSSPLEELMNIQ